MPGLGRRQKEIFPLSPVYCSNLIDVGSSFMKMSCALAVEIANNIKKQSEIFLKLIFFMAESQGEVNLKEGG